MGIRALSAQEFSWFGAARVTLNGHAHKPVEWFTDDTGIVLGAIMHHPSDLDWSYVILRRDIYGTFRIIDLESGFRALDDARRRLVDNMPMAVTAAQKRAPVPHRPHKAGKQ